MTDRHPAPVHGLPLRLVQAIHALCDVRGDSDENRAALLVDCAELPAALHSDAADYFETEARRLASFIGQSHNVKDKCHE